MNDNQIPRRDTEGLTGRSDARPAAVHEGLGEQNGRLLPNQTSDTVKALVALTLQDDSGATGGQSRHHEADIVTRLSVALARIAQTDN